LLTRGLLTLTTGARYYQRALEQIVGPEPRAASFASSVIRLSCSVAPWPGQLNRSVALTLMPSATNISDLVPKDKLDLATANAAVDVGYPAVAPILPDLLTWLQDCNWPVAHVLAPFLASIGEPLVPHVAKIMNSDDYVWKYWMIGAIMRYSPDVARSFRGELERLVNSPTQIEAHEELDQLAQEVLKLYGWAA